MSIANTLIYEGTYRALSDEEYNAVMNEPAEDMEFILGQDHHWYIYSNEIDAYYDLYIMGSEMDADEVTEKAEELKNYIDKDDFWIFGDVDI